MTTLEHLTQKNMSMTQLQLGFPVRIYPWQDDSKALEKEQDHPFSMKSFDWLGKFDLSLSFLKTLEIFCLTKTGKRSKKSSFKLPKSGILLNGQLFQRKMWEPVTLDKGSGSLPTPTASDVEGGIAKDVQYKNGHFFRENKKGERWGVKLRDAITLLPTPTAMDHLPQRGFESMKKQTEVHRKGRTKLANLREAVNPEAVKLFNQLQNGEQPDIPSTQIGNNTYLNPQFVEEMMGYPIGWTASKL